jgi:uncharacterized protein
LLHSCVFSIVQNGPQVDPTLIQTISREKVVYDLIVNTIIVIEASFVPIKMFSSNCNTSTAAAAAALNNMKHGTISPYDYNNYYNSNQETHLNGNENAPATRTTTTTNTTTVQHTKPGATTRTSSSFSHQKQQQQHPPVISFLDPHVGTKVARACSTWGAFVLTDVDSLVDEQLQDEVLEVGHEFFRLAPELKEQYQLEKFGVKWRGYQRPRSSPTDNDTGASTSTSSSRSRVEGLFLGMEDPPTKRQVLDQVPTFGANVLPDQALPNMRSLLDQYHSAMRDVGDQMMTLLSQGLDLPSSYLEEHITLSDPILLPRMFREVVVVVNDAAVAARTDTVMGHQQLYQAQHNENQYGTHYYVHNRTTTIAPPATNTTPVMTAHNTDNGTKQHCSDTDDLVDCSMSSTTATTTEGLWSMMLIDGPGLEFQHPTHKTWHAVPFVPHSIAMNVGDLLDRLSNGRYISPRFRFNTCTASHPGRLSLPFLYNPSWNAVLKTFPHNSNRGKTTNHCAEDHDDKSHNITTRWAEAKTITLRFDKPPYAQYSSLLSQQVAKIFPHLVSQDFFWNTNSITDSKNTESNNENTTHGGHKSSSSKDTKKRPKFMSSKSESLTIRPALVVREAPEQASITQRVLDRLEHFYKVEHTEIDESHGWNHIMAVYQHANRAIDAHRPPLSSPIAMEILVAALLHDVDDSKYFETTPLRPKATSTAIDFDIDDFEIELDDDLGDEYPNAIQILKDCQVPEIAWENIMFMIDSVSCSTNGNSVPIRIVKTNEYFWLIPRWADRIEAVGARGVVRCCQYSRDKGLPLSSVASPRPKSIEELFQYYVTPSRFQAYQDRGGSSLDMISHYYDKLLHVACPPVSIVQNSYLEAQLENSSKELVEVCLRFGRTGQVDKAYIQSLADKEE